MSFVRVELIDERLNIALVPGKVGITSHFKLAAPMRKG
jgi:hypothetical protein